MGLSFDFSLGKPVDEGAGRWINGSVISNDIGYLFKAGLQRRHPSGMLQCHTVRLEVGSPFAANDFAAYLRLVSTGLFETTSCILALYDTHELAPAGASAIVEAAAVWADPPEHENLSLLHDLTALGQQLEEVRKKERLGVAFANFAARKMS